MTFLLRKVNGEHWLDTVAGTIVSAQKLADFLPKQGGISFYFVDENKTNINQIATALACGKQKFAEVGFVLVKEQILLDNNIQIDRKKAGETADAEVNQWHRDVIVNSAQELVNLVQLICNEPDFDIIQRNDICRLAKEAILNGKLDTSKLKLESVTELRELITHLSRKLTESTTT